MLRHYYHLETDIAKYFLSYYRLLLVIDFIYNVSNILNDLSDPKSKHDGQAGGARVCKNKCYICSLLFCVQLHHADLKGTTLSILYPK